MQCLDVIAMTLNPVHLYKPYHKTSISLSLVSRAPNINIILTLNSIKVFRYIYIYTFKHILSPENNYI